MTSTSKTNFASRVATTRPSDSARNNSHHINKSLNPKTMKPKSEVKYRLVLSHCPNGDIMYDARRGYWTPPMDAARTEEAADNFYDAKQKFLAWINRNGLGGSNLDVNAGNLMDGKILVA